VRPVQEVVNKAHCPFCLKMRNWVGGGRTGEYQNSTWFRLSGCILTQAEVQNLKKIFKLSVKFLYIIGFS
jgi:hypothetical protein